MRWSLASAALAALVACAGCHGRPPATPEARSIVLAGTVVDPAGAAVAGAEVAIVSDEMAHTRTDRRGHFELITQAGRWGVSAQLPGSALVGGFVASRAYETDAREIRIALGGGGGVAVRGRVIGERAPSGVYLEIDADGDPDPGGFAIPVSADGTFAATLPRADRYQVGVLDGGIGESLFVDRTGDELDLTYPITVPAPPSDEVVAWVQAHVLPLTSVDPGHGFDDLTGLGDIVGGAHLVGLGEATHGTHEFFQLKLRVFEYLVSKLGFTVFALETNETAAINEYVLHGTGSARAAVELTPFWVWKTDEMVSVIEWIRAWNASPEHPAKVQFVGIDIEFSTSAYASLAAYLAKVDPAERDALLAPIAAYAAPAWPTLEPAAQQTTAAWGATLVQTFDANRAAWVAAAGAEEFEHARRVLAQFAQAVTADALGDGTPAAFAVRDSAMAENIAWHREHQPPGTRMVVWAHDQHVANRYKWPHNLGSQLRARFGDDYRNFGMMFGHGSFNANHPDKVEAITLGPAPESNASTVFSRTGKAVLAFDLRALPASGPVHEWFARPRPVRETGAPFFTEQAMTVPQALASLYDAVLFVEATTPSHLLADR